MKGPKASTKTKQPLEWATQVSIGLANRECFGENSIDTVAYYISQSPAIKELVEAADEYLTVDRWDHIEKVRTHKRLQSALQPFKASTGGG